MPRVNEIERSLAQVLAYGNAGSGKTFWACSAAEAGYNVLYLNMDAPPIVLKSLSPAAQERVYHIDIRDTDKESTAAVFLSHFLSQNAVGTVAIEESTRRIDKNPFSNATLVNVTDWDHNYIIVVDHLTALVNSINHQYARENNIDLSDAEKPEWPGFRFGRLLMDFIIGQLRKLPCHLILIGHETVYEKYEKRGAKQELVLQRTQPVSISNPHGMLVAPSFQEVYHFVRKSVTNFSIEVDGDLRKDAQSKVFKGQQFDSQKDLTLAKLLAKLGNSPDKDLPLIDFQVQPASKFVQAMRGPQAAKTDKVKPITTNTATATPKAKI